MTKTGKVCQIAHGYKNKWSIRNIFFSKYPSQENIKRKTSNNQNIILKTYLVFIFRYGWINIALELI